MPSLQRLASNKSKMRKEDIIVLIAGAIVTIFTGGMLIWFFRVVT